MKVGDRLIRSIPASAGQPRTQTVMLWPRRGLSPRVRGSQASCRLQRIHDGSIPASAGQPILRYCTSSAARVYPRECGAALRVAGLLPALAGLSPRVRGSRDKCTYTLDTPRSIPASAGQPVRHRRTGRRYAVYPRECGAAAMQHNRQVSQTGLSPRVRGSPLFVRSCS